MYAPYSVLGVCSSRTCPLRVHLDRVSGKGICGGGSRLLHLHPALLLLLIYRLLSSLKPRHVGPRGCPFFPPTSYTNRCNSFLSPQLGRLWRVRSRGQQPAPVLSLCRGPGSRGICGSGPGRPALPAAVRRGNVAAPCHAPPVCREAWAPLARSGHYVLSADQRPRQQRHWLRWLRPRWPLSSRRNRPERLKLG
jgi:hypothetical protein